MHPKTEPLAQPVQKREIFGWAMFDFANSAYTTIVITVVFSLYFTNYIVPASSSMKHGYWSIALIISALLALVLSPFIGVLCDISGYKKRYLMVTTFLCSVFTMSLYFVKPGDVWLAIFLVVISNTAWMLTESFCASFLSDISNKRNVAFISGLGWGIGYLGGLLSLAVVMFVILADNNAKTAAIIQSNQQAMLFVGAYFLIASLPTFIFLKDRSQKQSSNLSSKQVFSLGIQRLADSISIVRSYPTLFKFFLAFTVYMAGYAIIIKFVGIYAQQQLNLSSSQLTLMFIYLQISAFAGALVFGYLDKFFGAKKSILITLCWWVAGVFLIYFISDLADLLAMDSKQLFTYIALIIGLGIGATQSSSRAVVSLLTKQEDSALMFGFWGMFSRIAILLGMSYGFVADWVGLDNALLLIIIFFVIGGSMIKRIPLEQGIVQK